MPTLYARAVAPGGGRLTDSEIVKIIKMSLKERDTLKRARLCGIIHQLQLADEAGGDGAVYRRKAFAMALPILRGLV